jgi:hypothetical protein
MLPTKKTKPSDDPMQYSILLYGPTKVGKSTFASQADKAIFLASEPGLNALSVFKVDIDSWPALLAACKALDTEEHEFKTIVLDTVDNLYEFCLEHVCRGLKDKDGHPISHPADLGYGKGWSAVNLEFKRVLTKLAAMPQGLILISHSKEKEIETKTGSYTKIVPSSGGAKIILGLMDLVLMTEVQSTKTEDGIMHRRIIHTKPTSTYDAGDRTGKLPAELPLDYKAFTDAFTKATKGSK